MQSVGRIIKTEGMSPTYPIRFPLFPRPIWRGWYTINHCRGYIHIDSLILKKNSRSWWPRLVKIKLSLSLRLYVQRRKGGEVLGRKRQRDPCQCVPISPYFSFERNQMERKREREGEQKKKGDLEEPGNQPRVAMWHYTPSGLRYRVAKVPLSFPIGGHAQKNNWRARLYFSVVLFFSR